MGFSGRGSICLLLIITRIEFVPFFQFFSLLVFFRLHCFVLLLLGFSRLIKSILGHGNFLVPFYRIATLLILECERNHWRMRLEFFFPGSFGIDYYILLSKLAGLTKHTCQPYLR